MHRSLAFCLLALAVLPAAAVAAEAALLPSDEARLFSEEQNAFIGAYHRKLLETYDIDYRVLTHSGEEDINRLANAYFNREGVGSESRTKRGLLLVINPRQNRVRLEVGKALEGVYTDAFISYIEHRQMIPFFKAGQVASGVLATTELVFARAADAAAGKAFDESAAGAGSAGGGAANAAGIGEGMEEKSAQPLAPQPEGAGPGDVVSSYLAAMKARNSNPDLPIYSAATKAMMKNWVVTAAQMDMLAGTYATCRPKWMPARDGMAVVIYPIADRACAPFFLVKEQGGWKLDLTMMSKAIRFNHMNQWHFDMKVRHPYEWAFVNWSLDKNGYVTGSRKPRWDISYETAPLATGGRVTSVTRVGKDSFGEKAGFAAGDLILQWNDVKMPDYLAVNRLIDGASEGEPFNIIIQRGPNPYTLAGKSPPR